MIWENCGYWNGTQIDYDDINPHQFSWWCDSCGIAVKDCDADDERCPNCGESLSDMDDAISNDVESGEVNGMIQNEEDDWEYP